MTASGATLLLFALWAAGAVAAVALAATTLALGRGRAGTGVPLLAAVGLAGLAASHALALVPAMDPRAPALAYLGALMLPALALLQIEADQAARRRGLARLVIFGIAFAPALLLPAQVMNSTVCVRTLCAPAEPFIALMQAATGAALLLLALPAVAEGTRVRREAGLRSTPSGEAASLYALALAALAMGLWRIDDRPQALGTELGYAVVHVALLHVYGATVLCRLLRPRVAAAVPDPVQAPAEVSVGALVTDPAPAAAPVAAMTAATAAGADAEPATAEAEAATAEAELADERASWRPISQAALQVLRDEALYRQPQLRRKDLADRLAVPEYRLSRALNAETGQSFVEIVNSLRVQEAVQRLIGGDEAITTVGYDVGFNSLASFNRVFREITGRAPTDVRASRTAPAPGTVLGPVLGPAPDDSEAVRPTLHQAAA